MKSKPYNFSFLLVISILIGAMLGAAFGERFAVMAKPFGDIFLNILFTIVVPMVFFSISSAIAQMKDLKRLGKIFGWMITIFVVTGMVSSIIMIFAVNLFPPAEGMKLNLNMPIEPKNISLVEQVVNVFTVNDFVHLFSKKNMLALIVFSMLIGLAASSIKENGKGFVKFLVSGNHVMTKVVAYAMLYAPIGLGAYFAYLVGSFGPKLFGAYFRVIILYYPVAILYFILAFSFYVYISGGIKVLKSFWPNIIPTSLTALGTGSSIAAIPANLEAAKNIGIPEDISEVVIPVGATIHMEGSCLAAILKISVLFGLFNMDFTSPAALLSAIGVAILSGTVISGIPAGGMLGELLIIMLYGFPIEAMPIISMVGTLVDPPATMINAVGDNVSSIMVARILGWKK